MNGLNSQALHAGVNAPILLADCSSVLKDRFVIGRLPRGLWVDFNHGGSGILCDNVHCRYFIGAAVGAQRIAAHRRRLCSLRTSYFHYLGLQTLREQEDFILLYF